MNGQCDPYATVTLAGPFRSEAKKTKVKKKTNNPQFDEVFYFEVSASVGGALSLSTETGSESPGCVSGAVLAQPRSLRSGWHLVPLEISSGDQSQVSHPEPSGSSRKGQMAAQSPGHGVGLFGFPARSPQLPQAG